MKLPYPLVSGVLLERQKRFLAKIRLQNGSEVWAHCANPGSMRGNAEAGSKVELMDFGPDHLSSGRKLRYKWIHVESQGVKVCVDTSLANLIVKEALETKRISELAMYSEVKPEQKIGHSRIDFLLKGPPDCYMEVKSVSMGEGPAGFFPDSVTKRGQKHLQELMDIKSAHTRAVLFFLLMRENGKSVAPADWIDPEYARLLIKSVEQGIEVLCYNIIFHGQDILLGEKATFKLTSLT